MASKANSIRNHKDTKTQRTLCVFVSLWFLIDIERKRESVDLLVPPKLRPGTIPSRFGHQPFECHIGPTAQLLEIGARRNDKLRSDSVVVRLREDIQWMRVNVIHHVFAHDQRMTEGAKIRLKICNRPPPVAFGQMKIKMNILPWAERGRVVR